MSQGVLQQRGDVSASSDNFPGALATGNRGTNPHAACPSICSSVSATDVSAAVDEGPVSGEGDNTDTAVFPRRLFTRDSTACWPGHSGGSGTFQPVCYHHPVSQHRKRPQGPEATHSSRALDRGACPTSSPTVQGTNLLRGSFPHL